MDRVRIIEVKESIYAENNAKAERLRRELKEKGTFLLNVMSSPGAGKTSVLTRVIGRLKDEFSIAVLEADVDSDVDAAALAEKTGVEALQLHTGGLCHMDCAMTRQGIESLSGGPYDLIILENVGNLVCPAECDTGAVRNLTILSVPEGHDKPLKYPLMYEVSDLAVLNKMDVLDYFDFDTDLCRRYLTEKNPDVTVIPASAKEDLGMDEIADWIRREVRAWKAG